MPIASPTRQSVLDWLRPALYPLPFEVVPMPLQTKWFTSRFYFPRLRSHSDVCCFFTRTRGPPNTRCFIRFKEGVTAIIRRGRSTLDSAGNLYGTDSFWWRSLIAAATAQMAVALCLCLPAAVVDSGQKACSTHFRLTTTTGMELGPKRRLDLRRRWKSLPAPQALGAAEACSAPAGLTSAAGSCSS